MFWTLYLAHLIGDYPLQTDALLQVKQTWWGLTLHAAIHLVVLVLLAGRAAGVLWLFLLALAVVHFGIDLMKNMLSKGRSWRVLGWLYLLDQLLHLGSILLVADWIERVAPLRLSVEPPWLVYAVGYLLATHVWFVTERVFTSGDKAYQVELASTFVSRMAARAAILTLFLLGWSVVSGTGGLAVATVQPPYLTGSYRLRALAVDASVSLAAALFILLAR